MDLSDLVKPIVFDTPRLGRVSADVMDEAFESWLEQGVKDGLWPHGEDLVRDFLGAWTLIVTGETQAGEPVLGSSPTVEQLQSLDADDLNTLATTLLTRAGWIFRPHLETGRGKTIRYRRKADVEKLLEPLPDETPVARLLRLVILRSRDRDLRLKKSRQDLEARLPSESVRTAIEMAAGLAPIFAVQRLAQGLGPHAYGVMARAGALARLSDPIAGSSLAILEATRASRLGASFSASEEISRLARASQPAGVYQSLLASSLHPSTIEIASGSARALRDMELSGLAGGLFRNALGASFGRDPLEALKASNILSTTVSAGLIAAAAAALSTATLEPSWLAAINARAGLDLPASALSLFDRHEAMMRGGIAHQAAASSSRLDAYLRPGWELTSLAVLSGASTSAGASLLRVYDDEVEGDTPLGLVLSGLHELDGDGHLTADDTAVILNQRATRLVSRVAGAADTLGRHGVIALAALAISAASLVVTIADTMDHGHDEAMLRDARRTRDFAERTARSNEAIKATLLDLEAAGAAARDARRVVEITALRLGPDSSEARVLTLYPDQRLRAVDERDQWVKVEVYNYGQDAIMVGWVERRILVPF